LTSSITVTGITAARPETACCLTSDASDGAIQ
jgi:hypothetical protein